jgi:nicotinamide mononucleotide transporter
MLQELYFFGQITSLLELLAMITGVIGVWLTVKESIWCFPMGIINVALYAWLFISPGIQLYADALLQIIYILLLTYGWYNWSKEKESKSSDATMKIDFRTSLKIFILTALSAIMLAWFFSNYTAASYPWLDSALTCASLAAQWMIAKKYIENWIVWILADLVYLPLYIVKHLPLTAILYFIFLILAVKGYIEWKKNLKYSEA